jgi:signal transduction histidine kinase
MQTLLIFISRSLIPCLARFVLLLCLAPACAQSAPVSMDVRFCSPQAEGSQIEVDRDCTYQQKQTHKGSVSAWLQIYNSDVQPQERILVVAPYYHGRVEIYTEDHGAWSLAHEGGSALGGRAASSSLGGHRFLLTLPTGKTNLLLRVVSHTPKTAHLRLDLEQPGQSFGTDLLALHIGMLLMMFLLVLVGWMVHPSGMQFRLLVITALEVLSMAIGSGALFMVWPDASPYWWGEVVFKGSNVLRITCVAWIYEAMINPFHKGLVYRRLNQMLYAISWITVILPIANQPEIGWLLTTLLLVLALVIPSWGLYTAIGMPKHLRRVMLWYLAGLLILTVCAVIAMGLEQGQTDLPVYIARVIDLSLPLGMLAIILLRNKLVEQEYSRTQSILAAQRIELESERRSRHEKRMLLDMLAHEIKNPLASISFAISTLSQTPEGRQGQTPRRLENVLRSVETIDQILEHCNLANGIEDEHIAPRLETIDLAFMLKSLIESSPQSSRLELTPQTMLQVRTDPYLLRVVAANLIDNALKYALPDTPVLVEYFFTSQAGKFDWGFSVSNALETAMKPDPEQIFERYYRHPLAQQLRGSGLGLSICRQICHLLGGHIHYQITAGMITFEVRFETA